MSLSAAFENEIQSYATQLSAYNEELNNYKASLVAAKDNASDLTKQLVTDVAAPLGVELLRTGATKLFGAEAGELVGKAAGSIAQSVTTGQTSVEDIMGNLRTSLGAEADTNVLPEAGASALDTARSAVSQVINNIREGTEDAVAGAEEAVQSAQEGLSSAAGELAESVLSRAASQVGSLFQTQVARIASMLPQNSLSTLSSADSATRSSVFGDVEMSNFADAVPRSGIPDTSLPFESAYEAPVMSDNLSVQGLTIGRFTGITNEAPTEMADSLIPTQEEALSILSQQVRPLITSDLLPQGAGDIVGTLGRSISGLASDLTSGVASGAADVAASVTSGVADVAGAAAAGVAEGTSVAAGVAEGTSVAAEVAAGAAAGAAAGPVTLVVAGLVAVGTVLYDIFHHHSTAPTIAPPVAPAMSVPSWQPGLATE